MHVRTVDEMLTFHKCYKILTNIFIYTYNTSSKENKYLAKNKEAGLDQSVHRPEVTSLIPKECDLSPNSGRTLCPLPKSSKQVSEPPRILCSGYRE